MTGMELRLDPASVTAIASAAIYDQLNEEARESIIKQAIEHLMAPEKDRNRASYGKTPLQTAFDQAIYSATIKVVQEKIANDPEVEAKILDMLGPLLVSAVEAGSKEYRDELASKLGVALGNWLADMARRER